MKNPVKKHMDKVTRPAAHVDRSKEIVNPAFSECPKCGQVDVFDRGDKVCPDCEMFGFIEEKKE